MDLKLSDICLTGEEKLIKTSPRKLAPTGDRTRAHCVTGAHGTASSTAVNVLCSTAVKVRIKQDSNRTTTFNTGVMCY